MRNSNPNQLYLGMDLSPAEWMAQIRKTIRNAKQAGADSKLLERQQSQAFNYFKTAYKAGRV